MRGRLQDLIRANIAVALVVAVVVVERTSAPPPVSPDLHDKRSTGDVEAWRHLAGEVEDAGVVVVEGDDDAGRGVEGVGGKGLAEVARVVDGELALPHPAEARGDDSVELAEPRHMRRLHALVVRTLLPNVT
mgnify:CR=1 FL=1